MTSLHKLWERVVLSRARRAQKLQAGETIDEMVTRVANAELEKYLIDTSDHELESTK